jgi:hypothetical protein
MNLIIRLLLPPRKVTWFKRIRSQLISMESCSLTALVFAVLIANNGQMLLMSAKLTFLIMVITSYLNLNIQSQHAKSI